ncbi:MAG: right-handed parallel beta-helix repeat-containing protein [Phycisphaerae bacterium]|nr:right-handed parallel beta-helix repeat-containing protein [Gemmatimonadaceae bacterium]
MISRAARPLLLLGAILPALEVRAQAHIELRRGLVITKSARVVPRVYNLAAHASTDSALIVIRGDNITVDFSGAELRGASLESAPDEARGVAVRVEEGRNVRVINARIRGYRIGILAIGTRDLQLSGNNLSHNWKPRLFSVVEHESLVDWMSYHKNEKREWMRFGAGIYLEGVTGGELQNNVVEQGSNGLLMVRTDSLRVHDNSFSFNSALGIGLYRSNHNQIAGNSVDYNVRGYSHGFFRRGQDSAGLLMYEQSSHNVVAWNSMTHSGDGLFLWAGQTTMDTGQGGANDNLFFGNDFSFAPTNGMEATFSRNDFIGNRIEGSDHGLWGGYSFDSRVVGNCFQANRIGIAIEHGQANVLSQNSFIGDSLGISLWANPIEPSDWGYPKHRDTKSRDYRIIRNTFNVPAAAMKIENTTVADSSGNRFAGRSGTIAESCDPASQVPADVMQSISSRLPAPQRAMPSSNVTLLKRNAIVIDEWGPFDWRSPKLWPVDSTRSRQLRLRVLGPVGKWRIVGRRGLSAVSSTTGMVGDTIVVTPDTAGDGTLSRDWSLNLEYRGAATTNARGKQLPPNTPVAFSYDVFEPRTSWNVQFFVWSDSTDPRTKSQAFQQLLKSKPLLSRTEPRLDYMWYRPTIKELPQTKYAAVATTRVTVPAGVFSLRTISDDAIRVWIDGKLAIDNWTPHESAVNYAPLAAGTHTLRVEYAQVEGWTELKVEVVKGANRSVGTAGPH